MKCRIDRGGKQVFTPNNERSKLFDKLYNIMGKNFQKALDVYSITETPEFKEYQGVLSKIVPNARVESTNPIVFQSVLERLQQSGLSDNIFQLNTEQLNQKLIELGVSAEVRNQIQAWHGSPHLFQKFSTQFMGSGEGAQAFGWGLYFTDLESIARNYAGMRSFGGELSSLTINGRVISPKHKYFIQIQNAVYDRLLFDNTNKILTGKDIVSFIKDEGLKNKIDSGEFNIGFEFNKDRNLYKVSLHKGKQPSEYNWLEWDKKVDKKIIDKIVSQFVKESIEIDGLHEITLNDGTVLAGATEGAAMNSVIDRLIGRDRTGKSLYDTIVKKTGSPKQASLFLLENGIDGIKYPAESISRGATSDNARGFNYVVFDENAVTIEEQIQFQKEGVTLIPNGFVITEDGKRNIYLNSDNLNLDTLLHENGHLFLDTLKQRFPEHYQAGLELLTKNSVEAQPYIDYVNATQPNLIPHSEAWKNEVLAQIIGSKGEQLIKSRKKNTIKDWLNDFWDFIAKSFGLTSYTPSEVANMTLQEFSDAVNVEMLNGNQINTTEQNRDVQVYITPATVRNFNEETLRLKELTNEYSNLAKEISQGNLENQEEFTNLQHRILDAYQEHIQDKVSKIRGVNVIFNQPYLGSWEGNYEPSLNMTLSISPNADTGAISGLLFDLAENTSQDAFILEERSEIEDRTPLTEFDEAGMMHYPQIRVIFDKQLTVAEKSIIAQRLKSKGVEEFSIDGDYFIVSIIDFNSETNEQKEQYYDKTYAAITTPFRGEGEKVGTNRVKDIQKHIRKSKYVGARNEGDEQSQTREYDRSDLFEAQSPNIVSQNTEEQGAQNLDQVSKAFNEGVEAVAEIANEYKKEFGIDSVQHNKVDRLFPAVSRMIAEAYEQAETGMTTEEVKKAYKALEEETLQQYKFIVGKGLKVSRWTGEGEPYPNSKSMLKDVRENNHLYFLPNSEAFGKEGDEVEGRAGLKLTDVYLEDGYRMTLSEVFRVVHDYFGHGILGNQFGAIGEENATLQHLDLYSFKALPAVILQTRGQNSWVNFSGVNNEALRKIREGSKTNNKSLLEEGQKEFRFATPKDSILPRIFNFKTYETARRIHEQEEIRKSEAYLDPRGKNEDTNIPELLTRHTLRNSGKLNGFSRRSLGVSKRLGGYDVDVIAEYEGNKEVERLIKNVFPEFKGTQKIYEISNGEVYRKMMIEALKTNKFKSSVTVHSAEEFSNMRLFVTEDGSTGITLTKDGFLGGAFGNPKADRPNNLAQLMLLGIKEGAITAEAFDTILPNYYSKFGFKAVSRTAFNEEYRPLKENGALEDWNYDTYSKFNNGRPDVVFFIYDGGDRNSIQNRIGQFDSYSEYQKHFTEHYDKDSYDDAYRFMEIEAINKGNYQNQEANFQINARGQELQQIKEQAIANGTFMKAPNGKGTNLNERQWLQVRTKAFTDWFGDWLNDPQNASKVVDENGEPLVMYHGTTQDFSEFKLDADKKHRNGNTDGFYFTSRKDLAEGHYGSNVKEVFLSLKNPVHRSSYSPSKSSQNMLREYIKEDITNDESYYEPKVSYFQKHGESDVASPSLKREMFLNDGYDGLIDGSIEKGEVVVFNPNQIKSATDNVGAFDNTNPDIRFQIGYQNFQNNNLRSHMFVQNGTRLGSLRTKPVKDGEKIDSVIIYEDYRNQGLGTELYLETIRNLMIEGKKLYSDDSQTAPARKIWENLVNMGLAIQTSTDNFETIEAPSWMTPETTIDEVINNEPIDRSEPSLQELMNFINTTGESTASKSEVIELMQASNIIDSQDLKEALAKAEEQGVFIFTEQSLKSTGVFDRFEIYNILESKDRQRNVREVLKWLRTNDDFEIQPTSLEKGGTLQNSGKIQYQAEESEITSQDINGNTIKSSARLSETITFDYNETLSNNIAFLRQIVRESTWDNLSSQVKDILEAIEISAIDNGIDLIGLREKYHSASREDILSFLDSLEQTLEETLDVGSFENMRNEFLNFSEQTYNKELSNTEVLVSDNLSQDAAYTAMGLLKVSPLVYKRVPQMSYEELLTIEAQRLGIEEETLNQIVNRNFDRSIEDTDTAKTLYLLRSNLNAGEAKPQPNTDHLNTFNGNFEYITEQFTKDFGKWLISSKNTMFQIDHRGITLTDPNQSELAFESVPTDMQEDLLEYSKLSKHLTFNRQFEEVLGLDEIQVQRDEAINNPESVKEYFGDYIEVNNEDAIIVRNGQGQFIRVEGVVFEQVEEQGNLVYYKPLPTTQTLMEIDVFKPSLSSSPYEFTAYQTIANQIENLNRRTNRTDYEC